MSGLFKYPRWSALLLLALCCTVSLFAQARYVFYMIGDGMGSNQVLAAEMYRAELEGRIGRVPLSFTGFPYSGQVTNFSHSNGITDSAAAGTCLASGEKTSNGRVGTSPAGVSIENIAERLREDDWAVGIMTSVAIDHATPASFYAHVSDRSDYYAIGKQLVASNYDFFGGAGFHKPENLSEWKAPNLYDLCEEKGYTVAHGMDETGMLMEAEKLILIQAEDGIDRSRKSESLPYAIDREDNSLTLVDITKTAISYLSAKEKPFFMMVEGGKIDYAGHARDGATNIREVLDFDEAVKQVLTFYREHSEETLIVVTADHETGGMALGNSDYTLNLQILQHQHVSSWKLGQEIRALYREYGKKLKWEQVRSLFEQDLEFYGAVAITEEEDAALQTAWKKLVSGKQKTTKTLYQDIDELGGTAIGILNRKSKLGWTTYGHTASPVPVFAIGAGAERFTGWHDMSELAMLILHATGK